MLRGPGEEALKDGLQARISRSILLDVNMPGIDGFETAELIRRHRRSAHTPIILRRVRFQIEIHAARGYALGAVDYLRTPGRA